MTESLRQRGQMQHQNRLLLQKTCTEVSERIDLVLAASTAAQAIFSENESVLVGLDPTILAHSDQASVERLSADLDLLRRTIDPIGPLVLELRRFSASVLLVGSDDVGRGIAQILGWMNRTLAGLDPGTSVRRDEDIEAARNLFHWGEWTLRTMRFDLQVESRPKGGLPSPPELPWEGEGNREAAI